MKLFTHAGLLAAGIAASVALFPNGAVAAPAKLVGTVGPSDTITLRTAGGASVRSLKAGVYTILVRDKAEDHDFRLVGPGVNKATGVESLGNRTWRVRFAKGKTYRFFCGPHADEMRGSFRVR